MPQYIDLVGQEFGRLRVLKRAENDKHNKSRWMCSCVCGREVVVNASSLRRGLTKSCGCLWLEVMSETRSTHGMSKERIYSEYIGIKKRCLNKNSSGYKKYGNRGITICEEWLGENGFINFYEWAMSHGYRDDLTIERIDVNGNYCPENCKWITAKEQANNKRNTLRLEYNGETHTTLEWEEITGITSGTIRQRLWNGWSVERALTVPMKKFGKRSAKLVLEHNGQRHTVVEWSNITGISSATIRKRLNAGWSESESVSIPPQKRRKNVVNNKIDNRTEIKYN